MRLTGLLICSILTGCGSAMAERPNDAVVSMTLCADGYVHAFPELEPRLAALSWQSKSTLSVTPNHLQSLPQTDSDPERAIFWEGATRISSAGGQGDIDLKWGEDFETVWENLERLSLELNLTDPSPDLQGKLDALPRLKNEPYILYLDRSGATAGPGTFVDAVIKEAGARNIIKTEGWHSPDTETLIQLKPDLILTSFMESNYSSINDRAVRHSALDRKIKSVPNIHIAGKYWPCAGPGLVTATEHLSAALTAL